MNILAKISLFADFSWFFFEYPHFLYTTLDLFFFFINSHINTCQIFMYFWYFFDMHLSSFYWNTDFFIL
jgi:hypothetical protein